MRKFFGVHCEIVESAECESFAYRFNIHYARFQIVGISVLRRSNLYALVWCCCVQKIVQILFVFLFQRYRVVVFGTDGERALRFHKLVVVDYKSIGVYVVEFAVAEFFVLVDKVKIGSLINSSILVVLSCACELYIYSADNVVERVNFFFETSRQRVRKILVCIV